MPDVYYPKIIKKDYLTADVCSITVSCRELAAGACAGRFLHIKCGSERILRRPISICGISDDMVRFVFEVKGGGTKWLSERKPGDTVDVLGPLGNGFAFPDGNIAVVGGGIGTPPVLYAAQSAKADVTAVLGFRSKDRIILENEFRAICTNTILMTDDGSAGIQGQVTAPLGELLEGGGFDAVMSCGPYAMQKAVAALCASYGVPCQVSLEERMGCGVGACLVCVCRAAGNKGGEPLRVCADGPVFNAVEVHL